MYPPINMSLIGVGPQCVRLLKVLPRLTQLALLLNSSRSPMCPPIKSYVKSYSSTPLLNRSRSSLRPTTKIYVKIYSLLSSVVEVGPQVSVQ